MATESIRMTVSGIPITVVRKAIKNLHLGVYPPEGRVRVAAPLNVSNSAVRVAVVHHLPWIRRQRSAFKKQARQPEPEMLPGESHYFLGRRYLLRVEPTQGRSHLEVRAQKLILHAHPRLSSAGRERLLQAWYREQLFRLIRELLGKWTSALRVNVDGVRIRRMKTRWGSCSQGSRRIWLNSELAKKSPACVDYVLLHETAHLLVKKHDDRFVALLDRHMANWRSVRKKLNAEPLAAERW